MRDYLVFQLYGPLASWGDIAVGETRPSALTPTKSAVLGLVAAALRLRRPDTIHYESDAQRTAHERAECEASQAKLAEGYGIAIKVETLGLPLSDYHTAQVPSSGTGRNRRMFSTRRDEITSGHKSDLNTILSRREYRQDTYCVVALWARPGAPYTLGELRRALLEPGFTLYLGRKACPLALPLQPEVVSAERVEDALAGLRLSAVFEKLAEVGDGTESKLIRHFEPAEPFLLWDSDAETKLVPEQTTTRRDSPLSRRRWQFKVRNEHRAHALKGGQS
ncbi:MAG: type I-E CRISPR-associated protein Cas5/CasD [Sulfuricaulis sp.]|uniref:type I-E CRISPR-associated protein Cas5/CasD n=1 Tax=Sulfuricaulis sp. TaxID=2003553 RepID=UPI0034A16320